jgi:hypothetical protein
MANERDPSLSGLVGVVVKSLTSWAGFGHRQWPQDHGIHQTEDRCIRADA